MYRAIDRAYTHDPHWLALRVSYGFNGVIVPQADLPSLAAHLAAGFSRRPPDHLLFEWFSGERADTRCATPWPRSPVLRRTACEDGNPINFNVY